MHEDLFAQAENLARLDPKKPKQANLRRAVSSTYYALFHFLVHEACCVHFGTHPAKAAYRHVLGRAFSHSVMKQACKSFAGGSLKDSVQKGLPKNQTGVYAIPQPVREIAATFTELQDKRHTADYDLSERFTRSDVLTLISEARSSVARFQKLPSSDEKKFFLACLWAWKELTNR